MRTGKESWDTFWRQAELGAFHRSCDRKAVRGKWWTNTTTAGFGLFMQQNYYGHGPLNGLTGKERVEINMKSILAWNKWS